MSLFHKVFIICICFFLMMGDSKLCAQYYDDALGLRAGTSFEMSYKRFIKFDKYIQQGFEVMAGLQIDEGTAFFPFDVPFNNGITAEGYWFFQIDVGFNTNFAAYAAAGLFLGAYVETGVPGAIFGGGISGMLGIEYAFEEIPLCVSLDWKPLIGYPRFTPARGAITIRYILPKTWH